MFGMIEKQSNVTQVVTNLITEIKELSFAKHSSSRRSNARYPVAAFD